MRHGWLLLVALAGCGAWADEPEQVERVEAGVRSDTNVDELLAVRERVRLVDVRTLPEYEAGHVPGAEHIPLDDLRADHPALAGHPRDEPLYLVCASGARSGVAADELAQAGFRTVNVQGGTEAWRAAGHDVDRP